jgi:hypothetical protein
MNPDSKLSRAINQYYYKHNIEYSFLRLLRLLFWHIPIIWLRFKLRYLKRLITFKTKLEPKKLTPKEAQWLILFTFIMAITSIAIGWLTEDYRWLSRILTGIVWAVPAYIWFEPAVVKYIRSFKGKEKFNAFEKHIGQPTKPLYHDSNKDKT